MKLAFPRLYAIMDASLLRTSALSFAELLVDSGVELIQYRNKQISPQLLLSHSKELIDCCRSKAARYVVNDRADIAAVLSADGLHIGQSDISVEQARALCGGACWIGVSTHNVDQVREADQSSVDYVAVGPVFPSATKDQPDPVVGIEFVRRARQLTRKPLVAIGGLTVERAAEVYRAGADSVAVARDLICAPDPAARARQYLEISSRHAAIKKN